MEPDCGLVGKIRDLVLDQIWKQLLYLVHYHRNIEQLHGRLDDLIRQRSSLQHRIDEARNNTDKIEENVLHWLRKLDELSKQVQDLHKESEARLECGITSCLNPWLRCKLSKRAEAIAQEAAEIYGQGNFATVSYRVPPQSMPELSNRESNEGIDSRVEIKNHIMEALRNPRFNMIGLCGLGGVGKTTIAKDIEMEEKNQKVFENVIMATVSQEMNIGQIQDRIIDELGMQLIERTEEGKASRLYERLQEKKNVLLILDDLWQELDLGKVGIPFGDVERYSKSNEGCKILLTSRNEELLSKSMKCQKIIRVGVLSEDEAWELFQSIAKLSSESSSPDLKCIATEIVQKCGGLPLAIATAAKAMKGKKEVGAWRDYLKRLKHPLGRSFTGIKEVDTILKLSYEPLSQEKKHIFLFSAMLSHDPSIEELLMYSAGLDILKHTQNMGDARDAIIDIVGKLKSLNLFLDSFSSHHFTMHDVFRDVALSIASKEFNAYIVWHRRLNEWPDESDLKGCKGICLQESDICDPPEELHGPKLEFFFLNSKKSDLTISNMFFRSSEEMKVLAITNVHFSSLPSLSFLQRLKALCLHSCVLVDITEVGCLRKLKVLSLANSEIERLPVQLAELTSLLMLNLSHCSNLKVIPPGLLSSLKKLEVLYMGNSFNQWKVEGCSEANNENASLEELRDLPISSLDIEIPNVSMLPKNLFLKMNLRRYSVFIGRSWKWQSNYGTSNILELELESSIDLTAQLRTLWKGVEDLHLYGSNGQENVPYNLDISGFPCLRHLRIESNDDIKYVVLNLAHHKDAFPILERLELNNLKALENLCEGPNGIVFSQLRTLRMENLPALTGDFSIKDRGTKNASNKIFKSLFNKVLLPKLEILELSKLNSSIALIWDDQLSHNSFNNLKILMVERCGFVKLVPLHVLKSLNNLEEVEVKKCDMLEIVFDFEDLKDDKEMESSSVVVPLKKLNLQHLPKLKNVFSNNCQGSGNAVTADLCIKDGATNNTSNEISKSLFNKKVLFSNLEEVEVEECDMLEIVFDFEDLNDYYKEGDSSSVVMPLKNLKLWSLPKLKNVWSNNYQGNISFPSLRSIYVFDCESLTSIFPAFPALQFPRLTSLQLYWLPQLTSFYPQRHTLEWPHLQQLSIEHCELEIFEKEVSSSSEIYEEESTRNSKYPLFSHDKVIQNLEELDLQGKPAQMIGSGQFPMYRFPNVKQLCLHPDNATTILYRTLLKSFPNLEVLKLSGHFAEAFGGDDVTAFASPFPKLILTFIRITGSLSPLLVSSPNLTHIEVTHCYYLTALMTSSTARSLVHLTHLTIGGCDKMKEIITKQKGENDEDKEIVFDKLKILVLHDLSELKRFCGYNYTIRFPLLDQLVIEECPSFKIFSPRPMHTPSLESIQLSQYGEKHVVWDADLNKAFYQQQLMVSRKVVLDEDDAIMIRNDQFPADCCPQVETLDIEGFVEEGVTFLYTLLERFPKLNELHVKKSSFEEIFPSHAPSSTSFHNLTVLKVSKCHQLVYLVVCSTVKSLVNLETLEIDECEKMEEIVRNETDEDMEWGNTFNGLRILKLTWLPNLKTQEDKKDFNIEDRATNTRCTSIFRSLFSYNKMLPPKLEILELSNINPLISLIWADQLPHNSFSNLKTLIVERCGFVKLIPLHMLKSLNNLKELKVKDCAVLEVVFDFENLNDYKEMESSLVVVPLKRLKLGNLPRLKNVWSDHYQGNVSFPSLRSVNVYNCESLTSIFPAAIGKGMLCDLEELKINQCGIDVIVAKDQVSESVAVTFGFPRLTSLLLSGLPNLGNFYPQKHTLEWPHLNQLFIQCCDELEIFETEVSGSSEIYEEANMIDSKYPLLSQDKVIGNLEKLRLQGKEVEKIGSGQFLRYHFPKLKLLHLSLEKKPSFQFSESTPNLGKLKLSGDFEKALGGDKVDALTACFPKLTLEKISIMGSLPPSLVSSPNLTDLTVTYCHKRTTLMTSSIARSLVHLTCLSVGDCPKMEEIVTMQEGEDDEDEEIFFRKLEFLELNDLPRLRRFCCHNYPFRFPLLDKLVITSCPKFKTFSPGFIDTPSLKSVQLSQDWEEHREIWDTNLNQTFYQQRYVTSRELVLDEDDAIMIRNDQFPTDCCPQVEILGIEGFFDEWVTFLYTLLERFPKLNELHLENCSFEEIFPSHAPSSTSFHNLTVLKVSNCHHLIYLVTSSAVKSLVPFHVLKSLNNLDKLEVSNCDKLEMVFGFEDLNDYHKEMELSTVVAPLSLTHLKVKGCHGLTTLMTSSAPPSLVRITHLSIKDCNQIEEIIMKQEGEDNEDKEIFFNQMKFMELDDLPRLKRFCGYNYTFRFPLLEDVTITECPQLTMFCPGAIHAPRLQSVRVSKYDRDKDIWMTDLNNTIKHLFTLKEVISTTWSMALNGKNIGTIKGVFPEVNNLFVVSFTDEGTTFPYSSLKRFPKCYRLYVEHCCFEEIFPSQDQIDFMGKIPPFCVLHIAYLDKLKSIWKDDSQLPLMHQKLEVLDVKSCCSLVKLVPSSASFKDLIRLSVSRCHQLIHLVTTSTAKSLASLESLEINDCKKMEEIVKNDTNEDVQGGITFNQLEKIKLTDMPSLKMFSSQSHTFKFPELEKIKITGCPQMKMFCRGVLETPELSKVKIEEHDMEWKDEGDLNKTMEGLSSAKDSINI